jgi:hypothetical protein
MAFINQEFLDLLSPKTKAVLGMIIPFEEVTKADGEIDFVYKDSKGAQVSVDKYPISRKTKNAKK